MFLLGYQSFTTYLCINWNMLTYLCTYISLPLHMFLYWFMPLSLYLIPGRFSYVVDFQHRSQFFGKPPLWLHRNPLNKSIVLCSAIKRFSLPSKCWNMVVCAPWCYVPQEPILSLAAGTDCRNNYTDTRLVLYLWLQDLREQFKLNNL